MEIAVLIKQVPVDGEVRVDPETRCLIRETAEMTINPADLNALTAAILLKQEQGGKVTVFTMGPEIGVKALKTAIAMGADEAWLITDAAFAGGDTLGTARVLAAALQHSGNYDLILAGDASSDGATGQVGEMTAELLGIPCAADARLVEFKDGGMEILRNYKEQKVRIRAELPCMVTVGIGANKPILPTIRSQMKANKLDIPRITNEDLKLDPGMVGKTGARSLVTDLYTREHSRKHAVMLEGTPAEIAGEIRRLLQQEVSG